MCISNGPLELGEVAAISTSHMIPTHPIIDGGWVVGWLLACSVRSTVHMNWFSLLFNSLLIMDTLYYLANRHPPR
ncbi:hypothetical protein N656DRAFT_276410 [Canariomyces notabilis]|uniref:Uncharacterized protein n=1 Tax=Canariomyces notabilis TaxID=2074819 RepID=A0AAN6YXW3_9PEZI|nr:hypothetical protein N656DRAFT_276410 [Canariomyces arenarius]